MRFDEMELEAVPLGGVDEEVAAVELPAGDRAAHLCTR